MTKIEGSSPAQPSRQPEGPDSQVTGKQWAMQRTEKVKLHFNSQTDFDDQGKLKPDAMKRELGKILKDGSHVALDPALLPLLEGFVRQQQGN